MNFLKPTGLQQRFAFGLIIVITGVMLLFSSAAIFYISRTIDRTLHQRLANIATFSKESLSIALWQFNHDYVKEYIRSLFYYEDFVFARVISGDQIVALKVRKPHQDNTFERLHESKDMISTEVLVTYKQKKIGTVQLVMSRARVDRLIRVSSAIVILMLFIVNLAVFATNYILSRWYLFKPLSKLETTVSSIANGDLDTAMEIKSQDEIGHLAASVKKMMTNLKRITTSRDSLNQEAREREKVEEALKASLKEKEVLLKEIHHRVKNNMQIIQSLLNLQARKVKDPSLNQAIEDSNNRINSMALIHETLYLSGDLSQLNMDTYFNNLISALYRVYSDPEAPVEWNVVVDGIHLDLDKSIACGLIVNELVSNSMKHAFTETQGGVIHISLTQSGAGQADLSVSDNGRGMPDDFRLDSSKTLGLQIVWLLAEGQLDGTIEIHKKDGLGFKLLFPI